MHLFSVRFYRFIVLFIFQDDLARLVSMLGDVPPLGPVWCNITVPEASQIPLGFSARADDANWQVVQGIPVPEKRVQQQQQQHFPVAKWTADSLPFAEWLEAF